MSKASGVALVFAGLGVAAYALSGPDWASFLPEAAPETAQRGSDGVGQANTATVAKSMPDKAAPPSQGLRPAAGPDRQAIAPAPAETASPPAAPGSRVKAPPRVVVIKEGSRTPIGQSTALNEPPLDGAALTRELQRQLQRVGCYGGHVTGVWTPSTRRGMKAFTDRVNASLPVDRPDPVLLAMLQNHQAKACGPSCPAGESLAADGRCLPLAIVARAGKQAPSAAAHPAAGTKPGALAETPAVAASTPSQVSGDPEPLHGRMALAGPKGEDDPAATPPPTQAAQPEQQDRKAAKKPRVRSAEPRYGSSRRRMGAWIFHDAPVDRLLTW
jgi:hypothetical protein